MKHLFFAIFIFLFFTTNAYAEVSQSNAMENSWRAFNCTYYASLQSNNQEKERLFKYGYEEGKKGLKQIDEGSLSRQDVILSVSQIMNILDGPTHDFILGRIYQHAIAYAKEKFYLNKRNVQSDPQLLGLRAESYYDSMFCSALGKDE